MTIQEAIEIMMDKRNYDVVEINEKKKNIVITFNSCYYGLIPFMEITSVHIEDKEKLLIEGIIPKTDYKYFISYVEVLQKKKQG